MLITGIHGSSDCYAMDMLNDEDPWLEQKYGNDKLLSPFEITLEFNYEDFPSSKDPVICYGYLLDGVESSEFMPERRTKGRSVRIADPNAYSGEDRISSPYEGSL